MREANQAWLHRGNKGECICVLCHHRCRVKPGAAGLCGTRRNQDGIMVLPHYAAISSLGLDPIEKKPLRRFMPGTLSFSAGFRGCNLRCPFCQNWSISQNLDCPARSMEPEALIEAALASGAPSIAFTYSEPLIHIEYLAKALPLAREAGLATVLVTNGSVLPGPASSLLPLCDAVNVDLKCWSSASYADKLGGDLETVKAFIAMAAGLCHLEVSTLVVPGISDREEDMEGIAGFLAELSSDIALHVAAYHPAWKYREPPTSAELVDRLGRVAQARLRHVYRANIART